MANVYLEIKFDANRSRNEFTSHNISLFAIFLPKYIKIGRNLTKF